MRDSKTGVETSIGHLVCCASVTRSSPFYPTSETYIVLFKQGGYTISQIRNFVTELVLILFFEIVLFERTYHCRTNNLRYVSRNSGRTYSSETTIFNYGVRITDDD